MLSPISKRPNQIDHGLLIAFLALLVIGVVMIASIGVPKSIELSAPDMLYPNCQAEGVDCYLVLKKHVLRVLIGLFALLVVMRIPYRFWERVAIPFFVVIFAALISVLLFGATNNTFARSWINLGIPFLDSLQPAEFAKLALIFFFALWLQKKMQTKEVGTLHGGFMPFCTVFGLTVLPVVLQPDLGSTLIFTIITVSMFFVAGARPVHLISGFVVALLVASLAIANIDYLHNRFAAFVSSDPSCREAHCWQSEQAKIAVGTGGVWGKGLTQGIQKSYWLPQATDDFIFAASAEELGFFRIVLLVLIYSYIAYKGYQIANYAPTTFAMLVSIGISTWFTAQAFLNIAVNTALFPVTGITLPFVSYGGSSMVTVLIGAGILLQISKHTTNHAYRPEWRRNSGAHSAKSRYRRRLA